jgi:hypothetical protein
MSCPCICPEQDCGPVLDCVNSDLIKVAVNDSPDLNKFCDAAVYCINTELGLIAAGSANNLDNFATAEVKILTSFPGYSDTGTLILSVQDDVIEWIDLGGYSGYSGKSGYSGYSSLSGFSGYSGPSGYSGYSSVSGYSGYSATNGISGFSGYSGGGGGTDGVYTPDLTAILNASNLVAYQCQYMKVGNTVTVSGRLNSKSVGSFSVSQVGISLPVASDFGNDYECAGVGQGIVVSSRTLDTTSAIYADPANDYAVLDYRAMTTNTYNHYFTFTYLVTAP